jgi:excisionase family DNA binding protein
MRVFYRPSEVAEIFQCSLRTVYRRLQDKTIPSIVIRGIVRIPVKKFHEQFGESPFAVAQVTKNHTPDS